jgi:DNA-binding transcriptional LysR family regulator
MNIKLDRLKSFLLVAEESNLTRAAARRHSTPSAVSEHLRNLEDEFQIVLFKRSKQGMTLTAAGERLLMPVRQVFSAVEDGVLGTFRPNVTLIATAQLS